MRTPLTVHEEIYPHERLWRSSTRLMTLLEEPLQPGDHNLILPTLVTTIVAFEAFVNFCGFVLLPDLWADEKANFKGKPIDFKLELIFERLTGVEWEKGTRPYQTIRDLFRFRDLVVHAKVHQSNYEADAKAEPNHIRWDHPWDSFLTEDMAKRAREDILAFSQSIVEAMRVVSDHPHLIFDAYGGSIGHASSEPVSAQLRSPK